MPDELRVDIHFHGPFRVGTGMPSGEAVDTVDRRDPLPASSLKGLMRASAQTLMPEAKTLLNVVFGDGRHPSPWHWSGAEFGAPPMVTQRARIEVNKERGSVEKNALFVTEEQWAHQASFEVLRRSYLPPTEVADHLTVLACAAAGVHSLGADRRRGLGWVTCSPTTPAVDDQLLTRFEELRRSHRA